MTFLDLFSGIGGFRLGFEQAGHTCVGHCEIDAHADKSYRAMHNPGEGEWYGADITKLRADDLPDADVFTFGFPCQNISAAGDGTGLRGDRSGLYFTALALIKSKRNKPRWLLVENVANLFSVADGWDFATVLAEMDEAGYDAQWTLVNSADFGVPQNRERVYILAGLREYLRGRSPPEIFSVGGKNPRTLNQIVAGRQGTRVYAPDGLSVTLTSTSGGVGGKTGLYLINKDKERGLLFRDTTNCIDASYYKGLDCKQHRTGVLELPQAVVNPFKERVYQNGRRIKNPGESMFTLTTVDRHGILYGGKIRRLTPRECYRLQGFSDEYYERAAAVCSETQLYKQAGNAVTVPVVAAFAQRLAEWEQQYCD